MSKLIKGEFKKMFRQPLVYIMAVILCASLVLSLFMFSPIKTKNSSSSFSINASNVDEAKLIFENKKNEIDSGMATLELNISSYKAENKSLYLQNFKYNEYTIYDLYNKYSKDIENPDGLSENELITLLNNDLKTINEALIALEKKYYEIINSSLPTVKLTNETHEQILHTLRNAKSESSGTAGASLKSHEITNDTFKKNDYANKFKTLFSRISDIGLDQEQINELISTYINNNYQTKQNAVLAEIEKASTPNLVLKAALKYNANSSTAKQIIYLKIYQNLTAGMMDSQIQSLYNSKVLDQKVGFSAGDTTKYAINEKLTFYTYLWDNNLYDYDFAVATNGVSTSNKTESAIDFAVYAFQIACFVIIMFCVIVAATSISNEITFGTLKMIAIKPIKRSSIVLAKIITTVLVGLIFATFAWIAAFALGAISFGYNSTNILAVFNANKAFVIGPIPYYLILFLTEMIKVVIFVCISIFFSTLFKNSIPSLIISLVLFFAGVLLNTLLPSVDLIAFIPFFNVDLFVYFGGCNIISNVSQLTVLFSSTYLNNSNIFATLIFAIILPVIFGLASILIIKKRDII